MRNDVIFTSKLSKLRGERKLTQAQLSERSGVDENTISRIECNSGNPSLTNAARLARYLGVSVDELFEGFQELESLKK